MLSLASTLKKERGFSSECERGYVYLVFSSNDVRALCVEMMIKPLDESYLEFAYPLCVFEMYIAFVVKDEEKC